MRIWAQRLRRDVTALWIGARDPRTPAIAKLVAAATAAYALSPIDLIPDFIPILGLLDDLLLVPAGIWLARNLIPPPLMDEFRARAADLAHRPRSLVAAAAMVAVWLTAGTLALIAILPRL